MLVLLHPWLFLAKKILTRRAFLGGAVRLKTCSGNSSKKNLPFLLIDVEQYEFFFLCSCSVSVELVDMFMTIWRAKYDK